MATKSNRYKLFTANNKLYGGINKHFYSAKNSRFKRVFRVASTLCTNRVFKELFTPESRANFAMFKPVFGVKGLVI
jgi:cell division protein FtsI/penicillin-binding protein 2